MNVAPSGLLSILTSRERDFLCLIEFYEATYVPNANHGFQPMDAVARYATETCTYKHSVVDTAEDYLREALSMPTLTRNLGKQSNSCTIRFSNVSRRLATFVLTNDVEGMRMVIRVVSRSQLLAETESGWVLFVGKCGPPQGFDRKDASITAKQDLGQIEAQIPPRVFQKTCPLDFGGTECLGTELLTEKSVAYQAAFAASGRFGCNKSFARCTELENTEFVQGIRVVQIQGSFIYKPHHGFLYKLIRYSTPIGYLASRLFGKKAHAVGDSIEDGTPYGSAIPVVLGRWQMPGIPLQYQDRGEAIDFLMGFCRGPITDFVNTRNNTVGFTQPFNLVEHLGEYGGSGSQTQDTVFPEAGFFSRLAYQTGYVAGSDIEVEDPAPDISAVVKGIKIDVVPGGGGYGTGTINDGEVIGGLSYSGIFFNWTDNPVELARFVLTDPALLNFGNSFIDQDRTIVTSYYCLGGIKDDSNAERLVLPNDQNGVAGVDYHRYHSTGLLVPESYDVSSALFPLAQAAKEVTYEYYDPTTPPASFALQTFYRTRFTANIALTEQRKAIDFLYDTLLPSFRGYLSWNGRGQIAIRCERPADSILMRGSSIVGATAIKVQDIMPWRVGANENRSPLLGKILIGVGLITSEVRSVLSTIYTTDANSITLTSAGSGGISATASGATLSGGTTLLPAEATVTITGSPAVGDTATVTINGVAMVYTLMAGSPVGIGLTSTIAAGLAFAINSDPMVGKYIEARTTSLDNVVRLRSKMGSINLSSALEEAHSSGEETIRVMMSFAGKALTYADTTKANILDGSFKYLGSNGQTRYNQFKGTFKDPLRDFADQDVIINDYDHQDATLKTIPYDIDLSAVDNYNQASRLLNGANAKFGDGVDFFSLGSAGLALQLEEGDRICASDDSGEWRNVPMTIEQLSVNEKYEVNIGPCRIYSTSFFNDTVEETDVPLPSGLTNFASPPPSIIFNTVDFPPDGLSQTTDGSIGITTIRGGAIFGASIYTQFAKASVKRPGDTDFEQITILHPNSNLEATFEFIASVDGVYTVQLEVCNQWGCNTTKPTATIIVGFGATTGIANEDGSLLLLETGDFVLQE